MSRDVKNQLLQRLSDEDFAALQPHLKKVSLADKQQLSHRAVAIENIYFIETGVCSARAQLSESDSIEVGIIGSEGVTDHVMEKGDSSAMAVQMQIPGSALAIRAEDYADWIRGRYDALRLMVRYQQAFITQVSYTALAHGTFNIEERLARLLLMLFDRMADEELSVVHERLAKMLSVRRSGVTSAIHVLEGRGAIKATRASVTLRNRSILESDSSGSYGIAESEYARLFGSTPEKI